MSSATQSSPACPDPPPTNHTYSKALHAQLEFYYDYTAWLMRFVIERVDDDTIYRVSLMIRDPRQTSIYLLQDVFKNGYILFVVIASIVISFILLTSCLLAMTCGKRRKRMPTKRKIGTAMVSFVFCFAMAAAGTYLITDSVQHIQNALYYLPKQVNKSMKDIGNFVAGFVANLHCNFNESEKSFRNDIDAFILNTGGLLRSLRPRINPLPIREALEGQQQCRVSLEQMKNLSRNLLTNVATPLTNVASATEQLLNLSTTQMKDQEEAVLGELLKYRSVLDQLVNGVVSQSKVVQRTLHEVIQEHDYVQHSYQYLSYVILLPLTLVILCWFGFVLLVFRCCANIGSEEQDEQFPIRNKISDFGGRVLGIGGYVALFVTSLLFLMVALCFVIAFISMFLCMGLFEDQDLRLLYVLPQATFRVPINQQVISVNLFDTFYKCKNGFSFFDAIEGDKIMAQSAMEKTLSKFRKHSFRRKLRNFRISDEVVENVNGTLSSIENLTQTFTTKLGELEENQRTRLQRTAQDVLRAIGNLNAKLMKCQNMLMVLTSRSKRDKLSMDFQKHLREVEEKIIKAVAHFVRTLNDMTPQCRSIMAIWNDIGFYLCNIIAVPAQGFWVACLITAIGAFAIYSALESATTFLLSYEEEKIQSLQIASEIAEKVKKKEESPPSPKELIHLHLPEAKTQLSETKIEMPESPPKSEPILQSSDGKIEWVAVDDIVQQAFGVPPTVKHMPVLVRDRTGIAKEGKEPRKRHSVKRLVWSPGGTAFSQGSWQPYKDGKIKQFSIRDAIKPQITQPERHIPQSQPKVVERQILQPEPKTVPERPTLPKQTAVPERQIPQPKAITTPEIKAKLAEEPTFVVRTAEEAEDEDFDLYEGGPGKQRAVEAVLRDEEERMIPASPDMKLADVEQEAYIPEYQKSLPLTPTGESKDSKVEDTLDKSQKAIKDSVPDQQAYRASLTSPKFTPESKAATLEETSEKSQKVKKAVALQEDSGAAVTHSESDTFVESRIPAKKSPDTQKASPAVRSSTLEKKSKEQVKKAESKPQEKEMTRKVVPPKKPSGKKETSKIKTSKHQKEKKEMKVDKPVKHGSKESEKKQLKQKTGKA
ncbi:unnamed protein product [Cylicocyclus nassatus]|uniref:Uncharacterized protein n=1 Tax=Cylicocyclus nassatus TaxID=53992 RepID=A0AA36GRB0_CYLNA|nr:unnamed protein product [Cylicocyclus nassatus]